ncbi:MAG: PTS sugar transporter subunit IIA [Kiritimatiellae bacterium]|jgi:mannitol/fructose-specific phosphotransferase system IIA component (Ntr-type)|nr:PTS sugar transporter subunit IIA [Kiritimatiellia bacterium]MDD3582547.1 PTS sugar transporter subunit IIA [Kiritimatiellia bacterium]HHU16020.1 PTS sugar transporter subunit IIA [Lentisphaerota bacterium]HON46561.1 PTS sugar transporter subunit IIA [Kiritimatiellia bacterium]
MASFEEIIEKSLVCLNLTDNEGSLVIKTLIDQAVQEGLLAAEHRDAAVKAVINRELSASTALPDGIALPHGRIECVQDIVCMLGIHPQGIAFGAPDNRVTHVFVLLLVPATVACNHIHFLARLSRRLMEASVRNDLLAAQSREEVLRTILS